MDKDLAQNTDGRFPFLVDNLKMPLKLKLHTNILNMEVFKSMFVLVKAKPQNLNFPVTSEMPLYKM